MSTGKFKKRYNEDEEFKEKHLSYMKETVKCKGCGKTVTRCNMTRHNKSNFHKNNLTDVLELEKHKRKIIRKYNKKIKVIEEQKQQEIDEIEQQKEKELKGIDKKIKRKQNKQS